MSTASTPQPEPELDARWPPAAIPFAVWAVLLGVSATVHATLFGGHLLECLLQGGAAAASGVIALGILAAAALRRRRPARARALPTLSLATALLSVSIAAMVAGATVGGWLIIGGGLGLAVALGGLAREFRAQRRARMAVAPALASAPTPTISATERERAS